MSIWIDVLDATKTAVGPQRHKNEHYLENESSFHFKNFEFSWTEEGVLVFFLSSSKAREGVGNDSFNRASDHESPNQTTEMCCL